MMERFSMDGRVAIVTGAGSGIGRATAALLRSAGATVVGADLHGADVVLDVSDRSEVEALVSDVVDVHGRLDVLANIAGVVGWGPILTLDDADLDRLWDVNFRGVLNGCRAAGRVMVEQGSGAIVNMASSAVDAPGPGLGAYAISKAAVAQLTRVLAAEVAPSGVRVNAVLPGWVLTGMTEARWADDESRREQVLAEGRRSNPLGVIGDPDDIAHAVLYLASDASNYVTGHLLRINGGGAMPL